MLALKILAAIFTGMVGHTTEYIIIRLEKGQPLVWHTLARYGVGTLLCAFALWFMIGKDKQVDRNEAVLNFLTGSVGAGIGVIAGHVYDTLAADAQAKKEEAEAQKD